MINNKITYSGDRSNRLTWLMLFRLYDDYRRRTVLTHYPAVVRYAKKKMIDEHGIMVESDKYTSIVFYIVNMEKFFLTKMEHMI